MSSIDLWYTTRATGIVSLVLLTVVMILGMSTAGRDRRSQPAFVRADLHRKVSAVALVFLAIHILTAVLDSYVNVGALSTFLPFTSSYEPGWVALGTLSVDLFLAVGISSALRNRIPARLWRSLHWLAYLSWPVAVSHSVGIGTDMKLDWVLALVGLCVASVLCAAIWRMNAVLAGRAALPATMATPRRSLRPVREVGS